MEGLFFYWLSWIGWTWATFIMDKKNPARIKIAIWLLAVIMTAPYKVNVFMYEIHLSAFAIGFFLFAETKRMRAGAFLYSFISAFIIMLAYTSFLLFELFDPVWVLFDRKIMIAAAGVYLTLLLQKTYYNRGISLISGLLQGEILFSTILQKYNFPYSVSSLAFLDILIISLAMLLTWSAIETLIVTMSGNPINHIEGEEHKTS
ncbi:MAG TPA: hypothetical protein DCR24_13260 [Bacillus bacterium]|nr:hypothetical protein [Bacillus sp. (in: firmicutes)]